MRTLFTEIKYDDMKPVKAIEFGAGDISIFDIDKDSEGRAGIGFRVLEGLKVGENSGFDGVKLGEAEPELIMMTSNVKSLEVLLDKVQRAIVHLTKP